MCYGAMASELIEAPTISGIRFNNPSVFSRIAASDNTLTNNFIDPD